MSHAILSLLLLLASPTDSRAESAWDQQAELSRLDLSRIPVVQSSDVLKDMFVRIRDARDWRWNEMRDFPRRLSWLYPADGCYLRAALMAEKFRQWGYGSPAQLFVFGELSYSTRYEDVYWWYHVAPVYRARGQVFVVDPALDTEGPLTLGRWLARLGLREGTARVAVCRAGAVAPDDDCELQSPAWDPGEREARLQDYLALEWDQLEGILRRPPRDVLGDHPPWIRPLPLAEPPPPSEDDQNG